MNYYVYYEPHTNYLRIHKADCRWCNHGKGITNSRPDFWSDPYDSLEAASDAAIALCNDDTQCGKCFYHSHNRIVGTEVPLGTLQPLR